MGLKLKDRTSGPSTMFRTGSNVLAMLNTPLSYFEIALEQVEVADSQIRRHVEEEDLAKMAESIRDHGVLMPITVRRQSASSYRLLFGHLRLEGAKRAGLAKIPAHVLDGDLTSFELALMQWAENEHRTDMTTWDRADAAMLIETEARKEGKTGQQLYEVLGISKATASRLRKLASTDESTRARLGRTISMREAYAMLSREAEPSFARETETGPGPLPRDSESFARETLGSDETTSDSGSQSRSHRLDPGGSIGSAMAKPRKMGRPPKPKPWVWNDPERPIKVTVSGVGDPSAIERALKKALASFRKTREEEFV